LQTPSRSLKSWSYGRGAALAFIDLACKGSQGKGPRNDSTSLMTLYQQFYNSPRRGGEAGNSGMWTWKGGSAESRERFDRDGRCEKSQNDSVCGPWGSNRQGLHGRVSVSLGYRTRLTICKFGDELVPFWWLGEGTSPDTILYVAGFGAAAKNYWVLAEGDVELVPSCMLRGTCQDSGVSGGCGDR